MYFARFNACFVGKHTLVHFHVISPGQVFKLCPCQNPRYYILNLNPSTVSAVPLTHILTTAKLDATGQRWGAALSSDNFSIKYTKGSSNADTDKFIQTNKIISFFLKC